jgi:oxygen-independent coproporphyrinogen-3 oxidase
MLQCQAVSLSIYIHIPFCAVRCAYCDFNTYAGIEDLMPAYARAVQRELAWVSPFFSGEAAQATSPIEVHTVFFGGGTPSLLPADLIEGILRRLSAEFQLADPCEVTLEANPGTLGRQNLERLRAAGVNRLSLGAQSAQPSELRLLDRAHTFGDVASAVDQRAAPASTISTSIDHGLPWRYWMPGRTARRTPTWRGASVAVRPIARMGRRWPGRRGLVAARPD